MKVETLYRYFLGTDQFRIQDIEIEGDRLGIAIESTHSKAVCPVCTQESPVLHSTYSRNPTDLAWGEYPVVLHLTVKRYFCLNPNCPRRTFAERFPDFLNVSARCTQRVLLKQQRIGLQLAARVSEKLFRSEGIQISDTSFNRLIRGLPEPDPETIRVLGVDDWAKRKGQRYGTILVDLERGRVVDLLEDRSADPLVAWLEQHPGIEVVSRDRSQTYAEAISRGAPEAIQIADRFHLLKNLSETVFKLLQQEHAAIDQQLKSRSKVAESHLESPKRMDTGDGFTPAELRRKDRIEQMQDLYRRGWTQKAIAEKLHLHPKTVHRQLQVPHAQLKRKGRVGLLDPFKDYLFQRWNEGCHNATQLFREIIQKGFTGHLTIVIDHVRRLRQASGLKPKVRKLSGQTLEEDPTHRIPSLRTLTWWILQPPQDRCEENEGVLEQLSGEQPKVKRTISLAREFAAIVREQKADQLADWLNQAGQSGYRIWKNFADGLLHDESAVRAALEYSWSNGPTEGNVNRLKCLKRMMYGRAKDDLLRKRVLLQGKIAFT